MTRRPLLLDLYCGAGAAAMGYYRAGFDVLGVDHLPQPHYPFAFIRADAIEAARLLDIGGFAAVHASPPCQSHSTLKARWRDRTHSDLIEPTRRLLRASGLPYAIENVVGAPLDNPVRLCGSMFGLDVRRHRLFECSFPLLVPPCSHGYQAERRFTVRNHGANQPTGVVYVYGNGGAKANQHWAAAMGIDWMDRAELAQAVPPAYTELIGRAILDHLAVALPSTVGV